MNLYVNPMLPSEAELKQDQALEQRARAGDTQAAFELGAREAALGATTNVDAGGDAVSDAYEQGRSQSKGS